MALPPARHPFAERPPDRPPVRWVRRILIGSVLLFAGWLWFVWPPPVWYRWFWPRETAFMEMRRAEAGEAAEPGKTVPQRRYQPVPLSAIAPVMQSAVTVSEDNRFRQHAGIDYVEFRHDLGYRPDDFSWIKRRNRA